MRPTIATTIVLRLDRCGRINWERGAESAPRKRSPTMETAKYRIEKRVGSEWFLADTIVGTEERAEQAVAARRKRSGIEHRAVKCA